LVTHSYLIVSSVADGIACPIAPPIGLAAVGVSETAGSAATGSGAATGSAAILVSATADAGVSGASAIDPVELPSPIPELATDPIVLSATGADDVAAGITGSGVAVAVDEGVVALVDPIGLAAVGVVDVVSSCIRITSLRQGYGR
jgi:hypothetical protein